MQNRGVAGNERQKLIRIDALMALPIFGKPRVDQGSGSGGGTPSNRRRDTSATEKKRRPMPGNVDPQRAITKGTMTPSQAAGWAQVSVDTIYDACQEWNAGSRRGLEHSRLGRSQYSNQAGMARAVAGGPRPDNQLAL